MRGSRHSDVLPAGSWSTGSHQLSPFFLCPCPCRPCHCTCPFATGRVFAGPPACIRCHYHLRFYISTFSQWSRPARSSLPFALFHYRFRCAQTTMAEALNCRFWHLFISACRRLQASCLDSSYIPIAPRTRYPVLIRCSWSQLLSNNTSATCPYFEFKLEIYHISRLSAHRPNPCIGGGHMLA